MNEPGFRACGGFSLLAMKPEAKGVQFTFKNGYKVSVQWGSGNYCQPVPDDEQRHRDVDYMTSATAEVAILDRSDQWVTREVWNEVMFDAYPAEDAVVGWVTAEQVAILLAEVANLKED